MGLFSRFMLRVGVANRLGLFAVLSVLILFASLFLARSYELRALGGAEALCQEQDERGMIVETSASYQTEAMAEWRVFLAATNNYTSEIGELRYAENDVDELVNIFRALGVKDENLIVLKSSNKDPYKTTSQRSIDDMMTQLSESKARFKWLCVDACRNDLASSVKIKKKSNSKAKNLAISQVPEGVILTQSCRQGQASYEYGGSDAPFNNGLFTRAFVDAISGRSPEADANRDGVVTLGEIRKYLESRVPKDAQRYCNGMQNPTFTMMKGASFSDIADYKLFEDMPIFGHHPKDWRRGQTLRQEAEALEKEEKYGEALEKIKEAYSILPDVPEVEKLKNRIEELFRAHDNGAKAQEAYKKSEEALNAEKFQEALQYIDQAIQLDPKNSTYPIYRKLIESQQKLGEKPNVEPPTSAGASRTLSIAGVETNFRWCPPGTFTMGSPMSEERRDDDERQHEVRLTKGFWVCEVPVTVAAFRKFVDETGYKTEAEKAGDKYTWLKPGFSGDIEYSFEQKLSHPVVCVSWNDAQSYIKWANEKYAPSGMKIQLPSEAHWEYACRAGSKTAYWWGNAPEDGKGKANVADASAKKKFPDWSTFSFVDGYVYTSPVGSFEANAWGLYDMHGNVWEWCSDWYGDYPSGDATDPTGPQNGSSRVYRGGGWDSTSGNCRSADRGRNTPEYRSICLGFRLELTDALK